VNVVFVDAPFRVRYQRYLKALALLPTAETADHFMALD
jgi:hypothetical protein